MNKTASSPWLRAVDETHDLAGDEARHVLDPESAFLGSCMDESAAMRDIVVAAQYVRCEDFFDPRRAELFEGVAALAAEGVHPTAPLLHLRLLTSGGYGRTGGEHLLARQLVDAATSRDRLPGHVALYAVAVVDGALRRAHQAYGTAILEAGDRLSWEDQQDLLRGGFARLEAQRARLDGLRSEVRCA
ncbi:hypothetical protein GS502_13525 [Rhodococcus hoagii]|nr:hypothetical protein [Prescottella equi]